MTTEADACRTLITPKLLAAGWDSNPHSIAEQRTFTDSRIFAHGGQAHRRPEKQAHTAEKVRTLCASPEELSSDEDQLQNLLYAQ